MAVAAGDAAGTHSTPGADPSRALPQDLRVVIADVNLVVRGWGQYFRTGNAATRFIQLDRSVEERLRRLLLQRHGSWLAAGRADAWRRRFFEALGLCRLRGTVQCPGVA